MEISRDSLPDDPAALRDMILAQQQKILGMEAANRALEALIQALKLTIARLKRQRYGSSSEKIEREIAQLELALEGLEMAGAASYQPCDKLTHPACKIGPIRLGYWERKDTPMPRAVPIRTDIPAAELRRRAKIETDGRASRRMLALAAVLDGASREDAARLAGMDRQSLRARRGLLAASPAEVGAKVF